MEGSLPENLENNLLACLWLCTKFSPPEELHTFNKTPNTPQILPTPSSGVKSAIEEDAILFDDSKPTKEE
jgi:hypothetical protein